MRRISIKSAMYCVGYIAVALAALRNANDLWAGVMLLLTFATLGTAVIAVLCRKGRERLWWFSFALFGGGYMFLAFWANIEPSLGTTRIFVYLNHQVQTNSPSAVADLARLEREYVRLSDYVRDPSKHEPGDVPIAKIKDRIAKLEEELLERGSKLTAGLGSPRLVHVDEVFRQLLPGARNFSYFTHIGHCLSALVAGLIGAIISSRLYREPEPSPQVDPARE